MSSLKRRALATVTGITTMVAATLVLASPASAAPTGVELLAKSIGSAYTGPYAQVVQTVAKGGTATISLEVVNHTSTTGQYNLQGFAAFDGTQFKVVTSSVDITALIYGSHGYITNALPPGKSQVFTLTFVGPASIQKTSQWGTQFFLDDLDQVELGQTLAIVQAKTTTSVGTANDDMYLSTSGGGLVGSDPSTLTFYSDAAVALGGTSTFTVRLQNNTAAPTQIPFMIGRPNQATGPCADAPGQTPWALTAKVGATDITPAATGPGYFTPVLAKGKFITVTVSVKVPNPLGGGCASNFIYAQTSDESALVTTNATAT